MDREDIAIWDVQKKSSSKAVDIISSFITNMKHKLLKDTLIDESNTDIQWVITVPAVWSDKGKQIMSKAAEMAGLSRDKFMLLEEPEAVLKYYQINANTFSTTLPTSYRCIVLHVEDNAINSTIMKVEDDTYTRKTTVFSQYEGVTQAVLNFISDLFGKKVTNHCQKIHPLEYMTLFYNVKMEMKCVKPKTDIKMCIPRVWFEVFDDFRTLSDAHLQYHLQQDVDCKGEERKIKYELFWTYYNNFIQCRLKVIDHILAKESVAGIGVLFLAGDYIEQVFVDALKQQYPEHTILVESVPDEVILMGALMSWNEHFLHSKFK
ncbi:Hypothetical predicted protein [Mytilus galloprovincialis]|uniref:Uncharacterized protein n=1 Tax=Mytilus galloprovincialis TaxID=29158 RepID=A0A8B6D3V8_MYTGA|nr:Hypothetical predicted protein [Mytilus galloprovincialis]